MRRWPSFGALLALCLSACQPAGAASPAPPAQPVATAIPSITPTPGSGSRLGVQKEALRGITLPVWHPWFGVEASLFEAQVRAFNQSNAWGINVQSTSQSNYAALYAAVTASLPTAQRPTLVIAFPEHALQWDADGYVVDLNAYVHDAEYGFTPEEVQDFARVFWSQDEVAGRRVGLPAERSARFLLYNVDWGRGLGFDGPPRRAEDFRQQACRAHQSMLADDDKANDALGGWMVDTDSMTALSWLLAFGDGVLEGTGYRFLTPNNIQALTFVKQLYDDGCAWLPAPEADRAAAFAARKALFATAGLEELSEYARALAAAENPDEWTVLGFPGQGQHGLAVYGSSYVILKSTPEQQLAAWLFVRWMLTPENQRKWVEVSGLFPLRTSSQALLGDYARSHPQWAAALDWLPEAHIQPPRASWRTVRVMVGDGFESIFRLNLPAGRVPAVLAQMEATAQELER